jgi:outer membrane translocation and assembly module TamA
MDRYVAIDMSKAYLLARMAFEGRKVLNDDWLSAERRAKAGTMYYEIGKDFNNFFAAMKEFARSMVQGMCKCPGNIQRQSGYLVDVCLFRKYAGA